MTKQNFVELEEATCRLYGSKDCSSINEARCNKYNEAFKLKVEKDGKPHIKGMDEARIPMCLRVLLPHIRRAGRETYIQKMALEPCPPLPDVTECGYYIDPDGNRV